MKIVASVTCLSIGSVGIVHPYTIQCGIHWAAAICSKSTNIVAYKLLAICVTVVNRIEKKVTNGVLLKRVVVGGSCISRGALLVYDTKCRAWTCCIGGSK